MDPSDAMLKERAGTAPAGVGAPTFLRHVAIAVASGAAVPVLAVIAAAIAFGWGPSADPADWWAAMQGLGSVLAAVLTLVYLAVTLPLVSTALTQARAALASAESAAVQAEAAKVQAESNLQMVQLMTEERKEERQRLWMPLKAEIDDRIENIRFLRAFDGDVERFASHERNTDFVWLTPPFEQQVLIAMGLIPHYSQTLRSARDELAEMDRIAANIRQWASVNLRNLNHEEEGRALYDRLQNTGVRARHHLLLIQRRIEEAIAPFAPPHEEVPRSTA
jgi:hypothetical protein